MRLVTSLYPSNLTTLNHVRFVPNLLESIYAYGVIQNLWRNLASSSLHSERLF